MNNIDKNHAYVIRQSQEAVELALKASLRIIGIEPQCGADIEEKFRFFSRNGSKKR